MSTFAIDCEFVLCGMSPTVDELHTLRELRNDGKLIPFVGAGLSRPLGLPSWSELIDLIAVQLGYDPAVFKVNGSDLNSPSTTWRARGVSVRCGA